MTFGMSKLMVGAAVTAFVIPGAALAQTNPTTGQAAPQQQAAGAAQGGSLTVGATVHDTAGGVVGTIERIEGDYAIVATSAHKVRLPKSSFAITPKGPVIAMTAAQLDAAAAQAAPPPGTKPNVVMGASVVDTQGGAVGTITEVDAQFATVQLTTGQKVRLPITAFGAGLNGKLRIAMTAAQLGAAAGASAAPQAGATSPAAAAGAATSTAASMSNSSTPQ
ncbi:MAG TPA: hypothetical protein VFL92_12380 [Sphingomonas sp.]|nr:hypothetical protein [Sphingomonas sp.]